MENIQIIDVTPDNLKEHGMFCNKNTKSEGYKQKAEWYSKIYEQGVRMKIAQNEKGEKIGFIEYVPAEFAWRPIHSPGYMFIHCMYIYSNKDKNLGYGSQMVKKCEEDAKNLGMNGVVVMTSKGAWITNKTLFLKNGFEEFDKNGRFELCVKKFDASAPNPKLLKWQDKKVSNKGWSLIYSDQCPWNCSSAETMSSVAKEQGIDLKVSKITSAKDAQNAPTGFGVFNILKDDKEIEDHYISKTRFLNILQKEK
jgi:N-acetylglutamate synthase-like GNAT family acetyltransferase